MPLQDADPTPSFGGFGLKRSAIAAVPAFGLIVGTPAMVWTLVGIYGAASTGVAISSLTGAAAGAATAAWIGRAATLGLGGGMTAGRFALGPIGLAASVLTLPLGAAVAGSRERNYIRLVSERKADMVCLETIYETCCNVMVDLQPKAAVIAANLQRHTGELETAVPESKEANDAVRKLDLDLR